MSLTDFGSVSSQIGGGTVGQNAQRNFTNGMQMAGAGLQVMASEKAKEFQRKALIETAELGQAPVPTGGSINGALGGATQALKGISGLFGQGSGGGFSSQGAYGIGQAATSGFDLGSSIFSSGALESASSGAFDIGAAAGSFF